MGAIFVFRNFEAGIAHFVEETVDELNILTCIFIASSEVLNSAFLRQS